MESKKERHYFRNNPKHAMVFFSAGVILVLFLFLIGISMGMIVSPASQQQQQEQNNELLDHEESLKDDYDDKDKEQITAEKNYDSHKEDKSKPIKQMNCAELNKFIMSFLNR